MSLSQVPTIPWSSAIYLNLKGKVIPSFMSSSQKADAEMQQDLREE